MSRSTVDTGGMIRRAFAIAVTAAIVWSAATASLAQRDPLVTQKGDVYGILRRQSLTDPQQAKLFDDYFKLFFGRLFSQSGLKAKPGPKTFPGYRHDLRLFRLTGQKGQAYDRLRDMTYAYMGRIVVSEQYNPASRVNAMLILGDLNEQEGGKPLAKAFGPLLLFATRDDFRDKAIPDELKVAAMVGLKRWAAMDAVAANQKGALSGAMLKLLNAETPPAGRTAEAHDWMRRSAAEILAALGNPGPNNEVVTAYQTIIADSAARNTLRCEIAESLGELKYAQGSNVDFATLANLIGHQTVEICEREREAAGHQPRRRMFAYALRSALLGLQGGNGRGGLKAASAGTPGLELVEAVRAPINAAYEMAVDEDLGDAEVRDAVGSMIAELRLTLREKPAIESPPAAAEEPAPAAAQPAASAAAPLAAGN